jgi:hypothetical protein
VLKKNNRKNLNHASIPILKLILEVPPKMAVDIHDENFNPNSL